MMNKHTSGAEVSSLNYRESAASAAAITVLSLFCQWLNWFAYEKLSYPWGFTLVTPLVLCLAYHLVQLDCTAEPVSGRLSRRFLFLFSSVIPLLLGVLITVLMLLSSPQISVFNPSEDYAGTVQEVIATYAGRFAVTSLYLLIFGLIDFPVLRALDGKRK